jgi:hypothetical protein
MLVLLTIKRAGALSLGVHAQQSGGALLGRAHVGRGGAEKLPLHAEWFLNIVQASCCCCRCCIRSCVTWCEGGVEAKGCAGVLFTPPPPHTHTHILTHTHTPIPAEEVGTMAAAPQSQSINQSINVTSHNTQWLTCCCCCSRLPCVYDNLSLFHGAKSPNPCFCPSTAPLTGWLSTLVVVLLTGVVCKTSSVAVHCARELKPVCDAAGLTGLITQQVACCCCCCWFRRISCPVSMVRGS